MADLSLTAAAIRPVAHSPEDTLTFDAGSGYTPALGDIVAVSGNDAVKGADADESTGLTIPIGIVISIRAVRTTAGAAGYRVTALLRGLVEGFESLSAGDRVFTSRTAGKIQNDDVTGSGISSRPIGLCINATAIYFAFPSLSTAVDENLES